MTLDPEMKALVEQIGNSAAVHEPPPPKCHRCREPISGPPKIVRNKYDHRVPFHEPCWLEYLEEREAEKAQDRVRRISERVKHVQDRFDYYIHGHMLGRDGRNLCHPPEWEFARFDNAEFRKRASKKIGTAIEKWDPETIPSLLVAAPTGKGKTAFLLAWLWRYREQKIVLAQSGDEQAAVTPFVFATGFELAVARRNAPLGEEAPLIRHALDCGLLILDELGFEKLTEVPFELIDHRYRHQRAITVVTTGLRPKEFRSRYGDALYRRLTEGGAIVEDFPSE